MDGSSPSTTLRSIRYAALRLWSGNPRKTLPDLNDLTASIAKVGVLAPLLVRPVDPPEGDVTHEVIAGQCRYLAAGAAGLAEVPCNIRDLDDATALEVAMTENAGRNDPNPLEDAEAIEQLVRVHHRTPEHIADRLGRPLQWVRRRLGLLALIEPARACLRSGRLPLAHAQQLAAVDAATQARAVERFVGLDLPTAKVFARELVLAMHAIVAAPFDVADETLPSGPCGACPKRSDTQAELFDTRPHDSARCLDGACWEAKATLTWARACSDAKARHLKVIHTSVSPDHRGPIGGVDYSTRGAAGAEPVAVARDAVGRVVELFTPPPAAPRGSSAEVAPVDDAADAAEAEAVAAAKRARRAEAAEARRQTLSRLAKVTASPGGLVLVQRVALLALLRDIDGSLGDLRGVCEGMGIPAGVLALSGGAEIVSELRPDELPRALAGAMAAAWALDLDAEDASQFEQKLRAAMLAPDPAADAAEPVEPTAPAGCEDCPAAQRLVDADGLASRCVCGRVISPTVAAAPAVVPTVRVWIAEAVWDALDDGMRGYLGAIEVEDADGGAVGTQAIEWDGRVGFVTAMVPQGAPLNTLRLVCRDADIDLHVGDEAPAAAPAPSSLDLSDLNEPFGPDSFGGSDFPDPLPRAPEPVAAPVFRQRVLIVSDAGDWSRARKGLAAWDAMRTPGAGSQSGGSCAPLVMLHTPAVAHKDVVKLLERLAKDKRRYLDLGEVDARTVHDHAPSNRSVRERWNAEHPRAMVSVGGEVVVTGAPAKPAKKTRAAKASREVSA